MYFGTNVGTLVLSTIEMCVVTSGPKSLSYCSYWHQRVHPDGTVVHWHHCVAHYVPTLVPGTVHKILDYCTKP